MQEGLPSCLILEYKGHIKLPEYLQAIPRAPLPLFVFTHPLPLFFDGS